MMEKNKFWSRARSSRLSPSLAREQVPARMFESYVRLGDSDSLGDPF